MNFICLIIGFVFDVSRMAKERSLIEPTTIKLYFVMGVLPVLAPLITFIFWMKIPKE
jgi:hypothetical protein